MGVTVVTDSTSYIPAEMAVGLPLSIVSLSATLEGTSRREVDFTPEQVTEFYHRMRETGEFPTSSQPSVAELLEAFEGPASAGDDVVGVFISRLMSGTLATAEMARDQVLERHPAARIELVDSRSNSMEIGFAALAAARTAADGGTVEDAVAAAERMVARTRWYFVPATLDYLRMGGRIGAASHLLGTMLDLKPILTVRNGVTDSVKKVRSRQRAMAGIAEMFAADVAAKGLGEAIIHHIDDEPAAAHLASLLESAAGHKVRIIPLGPVVGLHVGPGSLGVVYWTIEEQHKDTGAA